MHSKTGRQAAAYRVSLILHSAALIRLVVCMQSCRCVPCAASIPPCPYWPSKLKSEAIAVSYHTAVVAAAASCIRVDLMWACYVQYDMSADARLNTDTLAVFADSHAFPARFRGKLFMLPFLIKDKNGHTCTCHGDCDSCRPPAGQAVWDRQVKFPSANAMQGWASDTLHSEILWYLSMHFASTLAVLPNLTVPCHDWVKTLGGRSRSSSGQSHLRSDPR